MESLSITTPFENLATYRLYEFMGINKKQELLEVAKQCTYRALTRCTVALLLGW